MEDGVLSTIDKKRYGSNKICKRNIEMNSLSALSGYSSYIIKIKLQLASINGQQQSILETNRGLCTND